MGYPSHFKKLQSALGEGPPNSGNPNQVALWVHFQGQDRQKPCQYPSVVSRAAAAGFSTGCLSLGLLSPASQIGLEEANGGDGVCGGIIGNFLELLLKLKEVFGGPEEYEVVECQIWFRN
jgi:hypothetical protein